MIISTVKNPLKTLEKRSENPQKTSRILNKIYKYLPQASHQNVLSSSTKTTIITQNLELHKSRTVILFVNICHWNGRVASDAFGNEFVSRPFRRLLVESFKVRVMNSSFITICRGRERRRPSSKCMKRGKSKRKILLTHSKVLSSGFSCEILRIIFPSYCFQCQRSQLTVVRNIGSSSTTFAVELWKYLSSH